MRLIPVGGIFWRLDTNGNLTAYDTSGNTIGKFIGGLFSTAVNFGTSVQNAIISTTTSTVLVNRGNTIQITPQVSGTVSINVMATCSNNTAGDGIFMGMQRVVGAANPAGGTAISGVSLSQLAGTSATANANVPMTYFTRDSGLTIGTTYSYELAFGAQTGGTATFSLTTFSVKEE